MDEERGHDLGPWPTALRSTVEASNFQNRTYGVRCLAYNDSCLEPTPRECVELDRRLDGLRAVLPNSTRRRGRNDSIVLDAYHYIATLQKQVENLSSELQEDGAHAQFKYDEETEAPSLPTVEVMKIDRVLEVRIVCPKRPGLLADVMAAVESRGFIITHTKVACHSDTVFQHLTLESEESVSHVDGDVEEDVDSVKAMLINIIGDSGH